MPSHRHTLALVLVALAALLLGNLFLVAGVLGQGGQPPLVAPDVPTSPVAAPSPTSGPAASPGSAAAALGKTAATALGTSFTYQGHLKKEGSPVDATCSFDFSLWDALSDGTQQGSTQTSDGVQVQAGSFTVQLDFGNQFTGEARWLETAVKCDGDGGYVTLAPRQPLNAVPYALSLMPGASVVQNADNKTAIYGKGTGAGSVGLYGESPLFTGVYGKGYNGVTGVSSVPGAVATYGEHQGSNGYGVYGRAADGYGTTGESTNSVGVNGRSVASYGVLGESTESLGIYGKSVESYGVYGESATSVGVYGKGTADYGVYGASQNSSGVLGDSVNAEGVRGASHNAGHAGVAGFNDGGSYGVYGESAGGSSAGIAGRGLVGVFGYSTDTTEYGAGVIGTADGKALAGEFYGNVRVYGSLTKTAGSFLIDHPLDPAHKYLAHSFVESPDMMNIYNGNTTTGADGEAIIQLPDWFEALNQDFRYQLTPIGQFSQAIVLKKIVNNQFTIKTDKPNVEVSWQVTGIRHDPFAEAHRIQVEQTKTGAEAGRYLYPQFYGQPESKSIAAMMQLGFLSSAQAGVDENTGTQTGGGR